MSDMAYYKQHFCEQQVYYFFSVIYSFSEHNFVYLEINGAYESLE